MKKTILCAILMVGSVFSMNQNTRIIRTTGEVFVVETEKDLFKKTQPLPVVRQTKKKRSIEEYTPPFFCVNVYSDTGPSLRSSRR